MRGAGSMASWISCGSEIITTSGFSRKKTNMDFHVKMILYVIHICVLSCISYVQVFAAPWTVAHQAPLSMGFSRQEHWSGLPCPPPGDHPKPCLLHILHWQAGSLPRKLKTWPFGEHIWVAWAHSLSDPFSQFSSVAQSCPTLWDPMNHSMPGLPETPWTTARQASLSITNSRSSHKPMFIESVIASIKILHLSHIYSRNKTFSYLTTIQKTTPQKNEKSLIPLNVASLHWNFLNNPSPPHTPISTQVQFVLCLLV